MQTKDEVLKYFKSFHDAFIPYVRIISPNMKAIFIISDKGEFNSDDVRAYCAEKVLTPLTTCSYSPQQNGLIERTWRTISEASIAMLITANLSEPYWEEARRTAGHIRNRITGGHPSTDPMSPFEKFFGVKPHLRHFKVFGVRAFPLIHNKPKDHAEKAQEGIFVGYSDRSMGGYRIYMPETGKFEETNHASFGKSPNRGTREKIEDLTVETDQFPNLSLEALKQDNIERVLLQSLGDYIKGQTHQAGDPSLPATPESTVDPK